MDKSEKKTTTRRDFLFTTSYTVGAVGLGAVIWPLIDQMNPSADVQALSSIEVDVADVEPGSQITVKWLGKPVFIRRRTQEEIDEARSVDISTLPDPLSFNENKPDSDASDINRTLDESGEWLVMVGVCTHLGCVPLAEAGDYNGWFCPCHGSHYDTSGRIRKGPAPLNMEVPKYEFVNANTIKIG